MPDAQLFPDSIDLGERRPDGDACVSPIGRRRVGHRRRPRPVRPRRPSIAVLLLELRQLLERQHAELLAELSRLALLVIGTSSSSIGKDTQRRAPGGSEAARRIGNGR